MRKRSLYLVLALGLMLVPALTLGKTIEADDLFATTIKAKHTIRWAQKTVFNKLVKFKKSVKVLGTLTTKNLHVTGDTTFDTPIPADQIASLTPDQLDPAVSDTSVQTGLVQYKIIEGDAFKALLDGNANNAFALNENEIILDALVVVEAAATAGTLDVGVDENWSNLAADGSGLFNDVDLLAPGISRNGTLDEANQATLGEGVAVIATTGDVTVQSSTDLTADATLTGKLFVTYLSS